MDHGLSDSYWDRMQNSRRNLITIPQQEMPRETRFFIEAEVATRNRHPVTCKSHTCMKVLTVLPTSVYPHAFEPIQPEVLDSVEEMLRKLLADTAPARVR